MKTFSYVLLSSMLCLVLAPGINAAEIKIEGDQFTLGGEPFDMWGIRVASGTKNPEVTDHLINQLDDYLAHNVNTVAVYIQGSSGGSYDPFSKDGKSIDPAHVERMEEIIEACDQRGMVVIVGIFYQMQRGDGTPNLADWEACKNAVRTTTHWLKDKGYKNVILNIANEQNSNGHRGQPWEKVRDVDGLTEMVRIANKIHPELIVGCGGYDHEKNIAFGLSQHVDALLFDTLGPDQQPQSGELYEHFTEAGITDKPIVNVEMFGGWTKKFMPIGVYDDEGKAYHFNEIEAAAKYPGLYVCFHSNVWCQGPSVGGKVQYNLAGQGTPDDPGIHWYFDKVLEVTRK